MLLAGIGVSLLTYVSYVSIEASVYQRTARAALVVMASEPAASVPAPRQHGDVLGEIVNARIGLRAVITEGTSDDVLRHAVGHVPGTAGPGDSGNSALAGHRDGLFRPLRHIEVGDILSVMVPGGQIDYQVEWTRVVRPDEVWVMGPATGRTLTLITCHPFSFIGAAPDRFIVRARERVLPT